MKYMILVVWLFVMTITIGLYSLTQREGFSTGIQLDQHFDVSMNISRIQETKPKYIVIIPYMGMNTLNLYIENINKLDKPGEIYVFAVDDVELATTFFTQLCSTPLSLPSDVPILLTKSKGEKPYTVSTEIVLSHQLNKILQKIKG